MSTFLKEVKIRSSIVQYCFLVFLMGPVLTVNGQSSRMVYFGSEIAVFNNYKRGNLDAWWQNVTVRNSAEPDKGISNYIAFNLGLVFLKDATTVGVEIQYVPTPQKAIMETNAFVGGEDEVYFNTDILTGFFVYRYRFNEKIEVQLKPGISYALSKGWANFGVSYIDFTGSGLGGQGVVSLIYTPGSLVSFTLNGGYRFVKTTAVYESEDSPTGFYQPYVDASSNDELLTVDWSGAFATIGILFNIPVKVKKD